ncbi:hypothetical protein FXF52_33320 [Micromonospora sp. MP36]|nr:hypothetical protein FXF52_33320 [Micromonospora sp. MP36]
MRSAWAMRALGVAARTAAAVVRVSGARGARPGPRAVRRPGQPECGRRARRPGAPRRGRAPPRPGRSEPCRVRCRGR